MSFNEIVDRRGTGSSKWDKMETLFGVSPVDGLAMWTADSDYPSPDCVRNVLREAADHGVFGYYSDYDPYHRAIQWWMETRHNWQIDTDWILTSQGLGNAIALCMQIFSDPGDHAVIFSPVYHEFAGKVLRTGRQVTECPLVREGDTYVLDLDDAQSRMTGKEKLLIWCSPQNPSGRVWTNEELRAVADFAERNDLILVSDEIHHDLVFPGATFVPMAVAVPDSAPRLVTLTAASKTFNIAGQRTGNMIVADDTLRQKIATFQRSLDYQPSGLGVQMVRAAYSPEGAVWADAQIAHIAENCRIFDAGIDAIPGVRSLPLQATYLAWVDFSGTGMSFDEIAARVRDHAKIAVSPGPSFGTGGENFLRINLATQKSRVEEAVRRLQSAFSDLQ